MTETSLFTDITWVLQGAGHNSLSLFLAVHRDACEIRLGDLSFRIQHDSDGLVRVEEISTPLSHKFVVFNIELSDGRAFEFSTPTQSDTSVTTTHSIKARDSQLAGVEFIDILTPFWDAIDVHKANPTVFVLLDLPQPSTSVLREIRVAAAFGVSYGICRGDIRYDEAMGMIHRRESPSIPIHINFGFDLVLENLDIGKYGREGPNLFDRLAELAERGRSDATFSIGLHHPPFTSGYQVGIGSDGLRSVERNFRSPGYRPRTLGYRPNTLSSVGSQGWVPPFDSVPLGSNQDSVPQGDGMQSVSGPPGR